MSDLERISDLDGDLEQEQLNRRDLLTRIAGVTLLGSTPMMVFGPLISR